MDNLNLIKEKFKEDNYARNFGIELDDLTKNSVKMHMTLTPKMNNFNGRPHGAAIYGLADAAFSVIGNNRNNICVALDCNINYHKSPEPGSVLYVEGHLIKQTRKIGTYLFSLYTNEEGKNLKIATMISTLYCTGKPHDPNFEMG
ncbi:MAG: Acyl-coenzyme A thioesterase PaaI [Promethearchaeota archaeon]|nr:MAG: Acyl-coenzyme A thioesterase PaaI [Candidatus Lokiarchaeota archaeon]